MAKRCGLCEFTSDDDAAFTQHMLSAHQWGASAAPPRPAPIAGPPVEGGLAKFCGNCGAPRDSASTNFCRTCGTPFASAEATAAQSASPAFAAKGGFWRRTGAYLLDSLLLAVSGFFLGLIIGGLGVSADVSEDDLNLVAQVFGQLLSLGYFMYFWSARGDGQSPGMRALGLRLIRTDGTPISVGRAFLRYIGLLLSILALFIGVIWVAFDKDKQGWHDKMADTYVIRV